MIAVFLLSMLLLGLQLVWMQALAFSHGHHLATLVLSVAMLGFGAGGVALTLADKHIRNWTRLCGPCALGAMISLAFFPHLARMALSDLQIDLLGIDSGQIPRILGLGFAMFVPFFFGSMALTAAFRGVVERIGAIYSANLLGSAAGTALCFAAFHWLLPGQMLPFLGLLAYLSGLAFGLPRRMWIAGGVLLAAAWLTAPSLPLSPYKSYAAALRLPEAEASEPLPHPRGRLDHVRAPGLRYAPDLSLLYTGSVPSPLHLFIDGEDAGVLLDPLGADSKILTHTPRGLFFTEPSAAHVLLLDPGGNAELSVLAETTDQLTLVDSHPLRVRMLEARHPEPGLNLHSSDPRAFLSRPWAPPYDLILFPELGMFGAPTGLHGLGMNTLFTLEGLQQARNHLAPGGRLGFVVWLDEPLRFAPRLLALVGAHLRAQGIEDPKSHVLALRGWGTLALSVHSDPVSDETRRELLAFAESKGFDVLWPPTESERFHAGGTEDLDALFPELLGPDPEAALAGHRFDIRPPDDNRPFFNQFIRAGDHGEDLQQLSIGERGIHVMQWALLGLLAAVVVLVLLPLLALRGGKGSWSFTLLTFSGLGAGFMFYEVSLLQRLQFLWGHPLSTAAWVLTLALCGMSAGSLLSRRLPATPACMGLCLAGIVLLQILLRGSLPALVNLGLRLSPAGGNLLGALTVFASAVPLGLPFPLGLRWLNRRHPASIPWACGIDSAFAVLAAPTAGLLAYHAGIFTVGTAAALFYSIALLGIGTAALPLLFRSKSS